MAAPNTPDFTTTAFNSSVTQLIQDKTYNWIADINASFVLQSGYLVFMSEWLSTFYCIHMSEFLPLHDASLVVLCLATCASVALHCSKRRLIALQCNWDSPW